MKGMIRVRCMRAKRAKNFVLKFDIQKFTLVPFLLYVLILLTQLKFFILFENLRGGKELARRGNAPAAPPSYGPAV